MSDTAAADAAPDGLHPSLADMLPEEFDPTELESPAERIARARREREAARHRARRRGQKLPPLPRGQGYAGQTAPGQLAKTTRPEWLKAAARARDAYAFRLQGYGYQAIAEALNFNSAEAARHAVLAVVKRLDTETGEHVRTIWSGRLDTLLQPFFAQAVAGDIASADMCLKIMDRIGALSGVNITPQKIAFTSPDGKREAQPVKMEITALLQIARDAKARREAEALPAPPVTIEGQAQPEHVAVPR